MKVLAVAVAQPIIAALTARDFIVEEERERIEAGDTLSWIEGAYRVVVARITSPQMGADLAKRVCARRIPLVGIAQLSPKMQWHEYRSLFLEHGGDDLLQSPVSARELAASVRAAGRRGGGVRCELCTFIHGDARLVINKTSQSVLVNDVPIKLQGRECGVLVYLAKRPGVPRSKEAIRDHMVTESKRCEIRAKSIDTYICLLRKKLAAGHPDAWGFIQTRWGSGYQFVGRPSRQLELVHAA